MALFNKKTIKLELEGRDQTIDLIPIPLGRLAEVQATMQEFADAKEEDKDKIIDKVAELVANQIVGATKEDILDKETGLDMEDIGFILGRLIKMSTNPKV